MRVHDTQTGRLRNRETDDYAILSHTWDATEQSFQDVQMIQQSTRIGTPLLHGVAFAAILWLLGLSLAYVYPDPVQPNTWLRKVLWRIGFSMDLKVLFDLIRICITLSAIYPLLQLLNWIANHIPPVSILRDHRLSVKIRKACAVAHLHGGFRQLWVDTSCIDKTSSSELSEAITSMFAWYRDAAVCYVYLADVPRSGDPRRRGSAFRHSRWFTRGWTLQELIAPRVVVFLSQEWETIGTKEALADVIEEITGIDRDVLRGRKSYNDISVAARMSWAGAVYTRSFNRAGRINRPKFQHPWFRQTLWAPLRSRT